MRHIGGKCIHVLGGAFTKPKVGQFLVIYDGCVKDRLEFQLWPSGILLLTRYGMCVKPTGPVTDGVRVGVFSSCNATDTWSWTTRGSLQYKKKMCLKPETGGRNPYNNAELVLDSVCDEPENLFEFMLVNSAFGWYLYIGPRQPNNKARLISPSTTKAKSCLLFFYYMYGYYVNELRVYVKSGSNMYPVWSLSGEQGSKSGICNLLQPLEIEELSNITLNAEEVARSLYNLDTSKACGPDGIPTRLLQECSIQIAPSICELFNHSLHTGQIPSEWKSANVTPIHKKDHETSAALYADDTKVYKSIKSEDDCQILQHALTSLECWSHDNNLDFNQSKCKVLTITRKKTPLVHVYHMNSKELLRVDKEKDLGVCVSANFNWDVHIHTITSKANKMLGLLKRTCPLLRDKTVRRTLYLSLVRSQLCYASEVWSPHTVKLKSRVESVQRRATAWILQSKHGEMTYQQRLMNLNLLPLCYEREISDL
ncbi:RNA-directed DNA polymerase from mobile element jockey, partial [Paramuricea clavata]